MDIHSLANRLQTLDIESIRDLHDQLLTTCTGRTTEARPEILREIAIIETTDSLRGALLGDLLGKGDDPDEPWLPDGRKNRIFSKATIRYHSDDSAQTPVFYQDNQNFQRTTLDANAATAIIISIAFSIALVPREWFSPSRRWWTLVSLILVIASIPLFGLFRKYPGLGQRLGFVGVGIWLYLMSLIYFRNQESPHTTVRLDSKCI